MKGLMNGISETQACAGSMGCGSSRRRLVKSSFLGLFATMMVVAPFEAFAARPSGAIKLSKSKLSKKSGFYCGNVKKASWIPGKVLPGGYFYSHQAERANLSKQLKKASKSKRSKIQKQIATLDRFIAERSGQCKGGGGTKALRFNFSGAVGLALKNSTGALSMRSLESHEIETWAAPSSNLQKVDSTGIISSAVSSGSVNISKFFIAPNDKLYVLFNGKVNLEDTSINNANNCLLAEVDKSTGKPICIESDLRAINWISDSQQSNSAIQFDAAGGIYYLGMVESSTRLRKHLNASNLDLINDNIRVQDFLVLSDGRVIIAGTTLSTDTSWLRQISPSGGLTSIEPGWRSSFIKLFPDGNVYTGGYTPTGHFFVQRYLLATETKDPRPWIDGGAYGLNPYNDWNVICTQLFCTTAHGAYGQGFLRTTSGKIYGIDIGTGNGTLMTYYPTVELITTTVKTIVVTQSVGDNLILAGTNSSGKNIVTLFDTTNNSETQLIGPDNEIEIYHLHYVASTNRIMFDGLRFSDNKYVIGQYDLNTMTWSASQTGSAKLVDFQTF